jgi:homoserine kinase
VAPASELWVSVPASSANLGPGFDCLAVALELRDRVGVTHVDDGEPTRAVHERGAPPAAADEDLVLRAFLAAGGAPAGVELRVRAAVPVARGLGSSAAAIAAGLTAARALGAGAEPLPLAARLEGHPDNVAAALLGGFVLAWRGPDGARALRLSPAAEGCVGLVAVVSEQPLSTARARAALPAQIAHADAAHAAGRAALLVAALEQGRPDAVAEALDDRLHERYRAPFAPLLATVRERIGGGPALGATLSGAGPSVLVWCRPGGEAAVAAQLDGLPGGTPLPLAIAAGGATVERSADP